MSQQQQRVIEQRLDGFTGAFELSILSGDTTLLRMDFAGAVANNVVLQIRRFGEPAPAESSKSFEPPLPRTTTELAAWLKHYSETTCPSFYSDVANWGRREGGMKGPLLCWPNDAVERVLNRALEMLNELPSPKSLDPDPTTGRLKPLSLKERAKPEEIADAEKRLRGKGVDPKSLAQGICLAAGDDGYAPYLQGQLPTWEESVQQVALLFCYFPNWLRKTAAKIISELKREAASQP